MEMKEEEHWKQFENSGRIEDYLSFVSSVRQAEQDRTEPVKEDNDAGIYMGNGNHTETISCGRV